jgi:hypothetical protein
MDSFRRNGFCKLNPALLNKQFHLSDIIASCEFIRRLSESHSSGSSLWISFLPEFLVANEKKRKLNGKTKLFDYTSPNELYCSNRKVQA